MFPTCLLTGPASVHPAFPSRSYARRSRAQGRGPRVCAAWDDALLATTGSRSRSGRPSGKSTLVISILMPPRLRRSGRESPGRKPMDEVLVENSSYSRSALKDRLYEEDLKKPVCEMCGQGESGTGWRSLSSSITSTESATTTGSRTFESSVPTARQGSRLIAAGDEGRLSALASVWTAAMCFDRSTGTIGIARESVARGRSRSQGDRGPKRRKVERPPYEQLLREVKRLGWSAVGRKYGVSDNAIRKWIRAYERERAIAEGRDPDVIEIPGANVAQPAV